MPKLPRRPPPRTRKIDVAPERVVGAQVVAKPADLRQAGLFDAPLPGWIKPCLPTLVDAPPVGPKWVHEIKWDGYRVSVRVAGGVATVRTRNGHDWTRRFPTITAAAARLKRRRVGDTGSEGRDRLSRRDDRRRAAARELQRAGVVTTDAYQSLANHPIS